MDIDAIIHFQRAIDAIMWTLTWHQSGALHPNSSREVSTESRENDGLTVSAQSLTGGGRQRVMRQKPKLVSSASWELQIPNLSNKTDLFTWPHSHSRPLPGEWGEMIMGQSRNCYVQKLYLGYLKLFNSYRSLHLKIRMKENKTKKQNVMHCWVVMNNYDHFHNK